MKLKYLYLLLFFPLLTQAQQIKRWTFCGVGVTGKAQVSTAQSITVATTLGQCPGCTVISDGKTTLRQGFQQPTIDGNPNGNGGGVNQQDCMYKITFSSKSKTDNCGEYFDFEYEGDKFPGMTFKWDFGPDGVPATSTDASPTKIAFVNTGLQVIKLTVTNKTCMKSQSSIVSPVVKTFVAQSKVTNTLCFGEKTGAIQLNVLGGTNPISYTWSNNSTTKDLTNLAAGDYTYMVTDGKGCSSKNTVKVEGPTDSLTILAKIKEESCKDDKDGEINLDIKGGKSPYIFLWNDNAFTQNRENLEKGLYRVIVTDANKCKTGQTIDLKRYCDKKESDLPNTFSPNGDGVNDTWIFPGIDNFPKNQVEIFNRWGNIVWSKKGMKSGDWNGETSDGKELPSGPYYYLVQLNDRDKTVFSGAVTIIK
jgi:gliding motility-associated-like protein